MFVHTSFRGALSHLQGLEVWPLSIWLFVAATDRSRPQSPEMQPRLKLDLETRSRSKPEGKLHVNYISSLHRKRH